MISQLSNVGVPVPGSFSTMAHAYKELFDKVGIYSNGFVPMLRSFIEMSLRFLLTLKADGTEDVYGTQKQSAHFKCSGGSGAATSCAHADGYYIRGTNGYSNGCVPMLRNFVTVWCSRVVAMAIAFALYVIFVKSGNFKSSAPPWGSTWPSRSRAWTPPGASTGRCATCPSPCRWPATAPS